MRLVHQFENGFDVYLTTAEDGDARELISNGSIEKELSTVAGSEIRLVRLNQVHSSRVFQVDDPDEVGKGCELLEGDGLVSKSPGLALGVLVADCAPVALTSPEGVFSAVHAGWQGVSRGILSEAVECMLSAGASTIAAYVGPSIKAECYEFKGAELQILARELGPTIEARTSWNSVSMDLLESVRVSLGMAGVSDVAYSPDCTACGEGYFSFRARKSHERHLMVIVQGGLL